MSPPHSTGGVSDDPSSSFPTAWLHLKIGQILTGLEDVRGTMTEMREEVGQLRTSHQDVRTTMFGLVQKLDNVTSRISDVESDVEALEPLGARIVTIENDIKYLKPIVERVDSLRTKMMGAVLLICSIGFIFELAHNVLLVFAGGH